MENIIFIGGIHGVGKDFLLHRTKFSGPVNCLVASEVLKWDKISKNPRDKRVASISNTQELFLYNLKKIIKNDEFYLLDGHFTLLNKNGEVERIPEDTFVKLNPRALILKTAEPDVILKRLQQRDDMTWNLDKIIRMQNEETAYAKEISSKLGIKLYVLGDNQEDELCKIVETELKYNDSSLARHCLQSKLSNHK